MGLKGYRLWVMGQLDSNVRRPTANGMRSGVISTMSARHTATGATLVTRAIE
jgi:hypothetical protein